MSQSTDSASTLNSIVERYFDSWRRHDVTVLRNIFSADATYAIQGKNDIVGIAAIENYWKRNALRQNRLQVKYQDLSEQNESYQMLFLAAFYDSEERQSQSVGGIIEFKFTNDRTRISAISERYVKEIFVDQTAVWRFHLSSIWSKVDRLMRFAWNRTHSVVATAARPLRSIFIGALVLLLLLLLFFSSIVFFEPNWATPVAVAIVEDTTLLKGGEIVPQIQSNALHKVERWLLVATNIITLALALLPLIPKRDRSRSLVAKKVVVDNADHLREMNKAYYRADRIVVFSGDFSFLKFDKTLLDTCDRLSRENRITLVSSKSETDVEKTLQGERATSELFDRLRESGNVLFKSGVPIKCSLVEHGGRFQLIYKYPISFLDGGGDKMCVLHETDESRNLLDVLNKLVDRVVSQLKNSKAVVH